jgi:GINS complex protein
MLLEAASDDLVDPNQVRRLLKDLREVRTAKMRKGIDVLDTAAMAGGGVALTGVGAMEIGEMRGLVTGIVENLRYFSGLVLGFNMLINLHLRIRIHTFSFFFWRANMLI